MFGDCNTHLYPSHSSCMQKHIMHFCKLLMGFVYCVSVDMIFRKQNIVLSVLYSIILLLLLMQCAKSVDDIRWINLCTINKLNGKYMQQFFSALLFCCCVPATAWCTFLCDDDPFWSYLLLLLCIQTLFLFCVYASLCELCCFQKDFLSQFLLFGLFIWVPRIRL